jgi:hypothetical protein
MQYDSGLVVLTVRNRAEGSKNECIPKTLLSLKGLQTRIERRKRTCLPLVEI